MKSDQITSKNPVFYLLMAKLKLKQKISVLPGSKLFNFSDHPCNYKGHLLTN
jgi:hypothetical protein